MFGIGFWEIAVILLVGTVVLGPEKFAQTTKKIARQLKKVTGEFEKVRKEIEDDK